MARSSRRTGRVLGIAVLLAGLSVVGPAAQAAPEPPAPTPAGSLPAGPWPPSEVLAADPATVAAPLVSARAASSCPPAGYGVLHRAPGAGKTVALTFDDGPGTSTAAILRVLQDHRVPATFFNIGVNQTVRPTLVQQEAAQGHLLGNHTWSHPDLRTVSAAAQAAEMDQTTREQVSLVGSPPCVFRPPYGSYDASTLDLAQARGMSVWNWSVDTEDWKAAGSGSAYWVDRIVSLAQAGGGQPNPVVLMHNSPAGNPATVAALPRIIQFYRDRGYTFVDLAGGTGNQLPDVPTAGVAAVGTAAGSVLAFVRGTDGAAWVTTAIAGGFEAFQRIPSGMLGGPAAVSTDGRRVDLFVVGTDRALWHSATTVDARGRATGFVPFESLGGTLTTSPAVASSAGGLVVSGRGQDDAVWSRAFDGSSWSAWSSGGGRAVSAPAVQVDGTGYRVHVVGTDGVVWGRALAPTGTPAAGWTSTGVRSVTAPAVLPTTSWTAQDLVLAVGEGTGLRLVRAAGPAVDLGGVVTSGPALVPWDPTRTATFARGSDRALWVNISSATGAAAWWRVGGTLA